MAIETHLFCVRCEPGAPAKYRRAHGLEHTIIIVVHRLLCKHCRKSLRLIYPRTAAYLNHHGAIYIGARNPREEGEDNS